MNKKISLIVQLVVIGCLTYFLHELAHLLAHLSLSHTVDFKINRMDLISPEKISEAWKQGWVSGSGAFFTFFQGIIAYKLLKKTSSLFWFNILLSAFVLRFAAALLGLIKSSDEIKTSIAMGLPSYFWTSIVLGGLFFLLVKAKKQLNIPVKIVLGNFLILLGITYLFSLI